jgi:HSP20 family protein
MLSRWFDVDPFADMTSLRSAMDRLLEQAVVRPGTSFAGSRGAVTPPMNIWEQNNHYVLQVYLPGLRPQDVELTVRQGTVTIKGRWPEPFQGGEQGKQATWLLQEFGGGEFTRSVTLPKQVAGDQVDAEFQNGILIITLPLAPHEQPRSITIRESTGANTVLGSAEQQQLTGVSSNRTSNN